MPTRRSGSSCPRCHISPAIAPTNVPKNDISSAPTIGSGMPPTNAPAMPPARAPHPAAREPPNRRAPHCPQRNSTTSATRASNAKTTTHVQLMRVPSERIAMAMAAPTCRKVPGSPIGIITSATSWTRKKTAMPKTTSTIRPGRTRGRTGARGWPVARRGDSRRAAARRSPARARACARSRGRRGAAVSPSRRRPPARRV